jgi:hypothetical protein
MAVGVIKITLDFELSWNFMSLEIDPLKSELLYHAAK